MNTEHTDEALAQALAAHDQTTGADGNESAFVKPTEQTQSIIDTVLNLDEFLSGEVRRPEKSVSLCLRPDLEARLDELEVELAGLVDAFGNPLSDDDESLGSAAESGARSALTVAREVTEVRAEMNASMKTVRFRALDSDSWEAFTTEYAKGLDSDEPNDRLPALFNLVTRCAVAPTISAEQLAQLRKKLGGLAVMQLANTAWEVNRHSGVSVPKSPTSSTVLRRQRHERS